MPNRKSDTNNHGAFSTDDIGMNYDYPEANYSGGNGSPPSTAITNLG